MHRRRGPLLFPLLFLLLLSLSALLLLPSHHHHSSSSSLLPFPSSNPNPYANPSNFTFLIKVLAFDRPDSLRRCLRSLFAADYGGDRVGLHLFLDHFHVANPTNESDVVDRRLEAARRVLDLADAFPWPHGPKLLHYRTANAGLQAQWLEAWWPSSDDEFAFVVEDDLELSPLYYRYLKGLILKYYYDKANYSPSVFGASLQRPRFVAGKHGNKLQLDSDIQVFLYQMVGTWGQLLFPKPWKEFRLWYDIHKAKGVKPILQGMDGTKGWVRKYGPLVLKFVHSRGYFNIYTNFQEERALSISHRDAGVNYGRSVGPDSNLLDESSLNFDLWKLPPLSNLKWFDFCFKEVHPGRIVRSFDELGTVLDSLQKQKTIIIISLYGTEKRIVRNLICHLGKVGMENFVLIVDNPEFIDDLARRGYAVIDANRLIHSIKSHNSVLNLEISGTDLMKEILVKAHLVKNCLESRYNLWLMDGNMIPISAKLPEPSDQLYDFLAARDLGLLFIKSSPTSLKFWIDGLVSMVAAQASKSTIGGNNFMYFVNKALEARGNIRLRRLDEKAIAVKLGVNNMYNTTLNSGKNLIILPQDMQPASVEEELETLGMWLIDADSSCNAVFCHQ
ncbi:hypothetical protein ACMD2_21700, partial [Ananas comosus]